MKAASGYWSHFDKIYCISLLERTDRRNRARTMFVTVGLLDRVEFEIVRSHRHNCEQGIYESHLSCIKKGVFSGAKNILIFEDDIFFDRFDPWKLKSCVTFLENSDWDIFFWDVWLEKA